MRNKRFIVCALFIPLMMTSCTGPKKDAKWVKYENNPVLGGGDLGTVFDVAVLKEDGEYKMYSSWRPQKSLALSVSADGMNWTQPEIVLAPN
ncbi:MAG: hypothetical protein LBT35_04045, partial [Tannerella sp.]|nr:hypothetical protein [Tannerella sp.]